MLSHHRTLALTLGEVFGVLALGSGLACRESSGPNSGLRERWFSPQATSAQARPAVAGELVLFGTGDGQVLARERGSGQHRWAARVGAVEEAVRSAALLARAGVVVAPVVHWTFGLDAATGRELWRYAAPPDVAAGTPSTPGQLVRTHVDSDGESVFIGAWGASISAVDLRTGVVRWVWRTPNGWTGRRRAATRAHCAGPRSPT